MLRFLIPFFNGMGSAAGVAWPVFGIAFASLAGTIGGLLSLGLGISLIAVFFFVYACISYCSYKKIKKEAEGFQKSWQSNKEQLFFHINFYLEIKTKNVVSFDLSVLKSNILLDKKDLNNTNPFLSQILFILANNLVSDSIKDVQPFIEEMQKNTEKQTLSFCEKLLPAFSDFVGIFGSIVGCSAGVSGLLTGVGLFISFATVPILGWSIMGGAFACALGMACCTAAQEVKKFRSKALNSAVEQSHIGLVGIIREKCRTLPAQTPQELAESKHYSHPVFTLLTPRAANGSEFQTKHATATQATPKLT